MLALIIVVTPVVIGAIPDDYFLESRRPKKSHSNRPYILVVAWVLIKNLIGTAFLIIGVAMLLLPGQGILTILIGLLLINYPGKYQLERKLISIPKILELVNWIRKKQGKSVFTL